jgi:hypothetical protein
MAPMRAGERLLSAAIRDRAFRARLVLYTILRFALLVTRFCRETHSLLLCAPRATIRIGMCAKRRQSHGKAKSSKPIGIGVRNEKSLHAALKRWYAQPGDRFEARVDGFIADILRDGAVIEIQTRRLGAIRRKLNALLENHRVRLVFPIAREKWIVRMTKSGRKMIARRKSPKTGRLTDLFAELVSIPDLINHENLTLEIAMIQEEEIRHTDGRGSWRRRGHSIRDHRLLSVLETVSFETRSDFIRFLPDGLGQPFSNRQLAFHLGDSIRRAGQITYCLKKMGTIEQAGKNGNQHLFTIVL